MIFNSIATQNKEAIYYRSQQCLVHRLHNPDPEKRSVLWRWYQQPLDIDTIVVAYDDYDVPIGAGVVHGDPKTSFYKMSGNISVFVKEECRRKGIGTAIKKILLETTEILIVLPKYASSPAYEFYKDLNK
jgi:GNAT superfamily N-acetyltransferase